MVSSAARPSTGPLLSALGLRGGANSFARMGELRAAADHMQIEPVDRGTPARRWQCPRRSALFTWLLLIMSPSSAFLALSAPVLAQGVSAAYPVTGTVLLVVATVLMALTSFTDPGKVPLPPANALRLRPPAANADVHVTIHGVKMPIKYCRVCGIVRPLRASHCRETDRCVERWDHFCPWVGTAVGRRNYVFFLGFVASACTLAFFVAGASIVHLGLVGQAMSPADAPGFPIWLRAIVAAPASFCLVGYCAIVGLLLVLLLCYHLYLCIINQTTYENVRGVYDETGANPFSRGVLLNLAEVCLPCGVRPPPMVTATGMARWAHSEWPKQAAGDGGDGGGSSSSGTADDLEAGRGGGGGGSSSSGRRGRRSRSSSPAPPASVELVAANVQRVSGLAAADFGPSSQRAQQRTPVTPPDMERPPSPPEELDEEDYPFEVGEPVRA